MAENSKIEWTLRAPPSVSAAVARAANSLHIKPECALVPSMMIVLPRLGAAINARQRGNGREPSVAHRVVHSIPRLPLAVRQPLARLSPWYAATTRALRRKSITPVTVGVKFRAPLPRPTRPAMLFAPFNSLQVVLQIHSETRRRDLHYTYFTAQLRAPVHSNNIKL